MKTKIYQTQSRLLMALFLIFCLCENQQATAQVPAWSWATNGTGSSEDGALAVATDPFGNSYAIGYFQSSSITFGSTTLMNTGGHDIFIVKYASNGDVIWAKSAGGSGTERAYSVDADGAGNAVVVGYFQSSSITFESTTLNNTGGDDVFVVKYAPNGSVLWAKNAVGDAGDQMRGVSVDGSGNVYAGGYFQSSTLNFGTASLTRVGTSNAFVVKYDANGSVQWARSSAGKVNESEQVNSVSTDGSGNVYAGGQFSSPTAIFGTDTLFNASASGTNDIFILRYNSSGDLLWGKREGGTGNDQAQSVDGDASGNAYLTGVFRSTTITIGSTMLSNAGDQDIFLVKYDDSGNPLWVAGAGGSSDDFSYGVTDDGLGNCYITGYYSSSSLTFGATTLNNVSPGSYDILLVKYEEGTVSWAQSIGSTSQDQGFALDSDGSGNIWITGTFASASLLFTPLTINNSSGDFDMFVAKTSAEQACVLEITASVNPVCEGRKTVITATGADSCTISPLDGTTELGPCSWNIIPGTTTTYTVTGNGGSCSESILITVNAVPVINIRQAPCQSGVVKLSANAVPGTGMTYQWIKDNNPIAGAIDKIYSAFVDGIYRVIVTNQATGCKNASQPENVTVSCRLASSPSLELLVDVFPNPFSNSMNVHISPANEMMASVFLLDYSGRTIREFKSVDPSVPLQINELLTEGIYFVRVIQGNESKIVSVVKSE